MHRTLFDGDLGNLDVARTARVEFGIGVVEYINLFFVDRATDQQYLQKSKQRAKCYGDVSKPVDRRSPPFRDRDRRYFQQNQP